MLEWKVENSEKLVVLCMSALGHFVDYELNSTCMERAHAYAANTGVVKQEEYAFHFAEALHKQVLELSKKSREEINAWMEARERHQQALSVATESTPATLPEAKKVFASSPRMTVEDWEKAGVKFKPVAGRGLGALFGSVEPSRRPHPLALAEGRQRAAEQANDAPWGGNAARVAEWAWKLCNNGARPSLTQRNMVAQVLSALHYAGFMRDGALIPVGYGRKATVRLRKPGGA